MPSSYTFCGCVASDYPETRDAHAVIVGRVSPGDEREFDAPFGAEAPKDVDERAWWFPAPTADWFASDGPLPKRLPDPEDGPHEHPGFGEPMTGAGHPADGTWSPPVSRDGPEKAAARPAVPAPAAPPVPRPAVSVPPPATPADGD